MASSSTGFRFKPTDGEGMMASSLTVPMGFRFRPTDGEICEYLGKKVKGLTLPSNMITEKDVYACEPWCLAGDDDDQSTMKYYFVKREKLSKNENGKRPKRGLEGDDLVGGWWKATTGDKDIIKGDVDDTTIVGRGKSLKFYTFKNKNKNKKRTEAIQTHWIMHEYSLPTNSFQEWVVCGIRYKGEVNKEELVKSKDIEKLSDMGKADQLEKNVHESALGKEEQQQQWAQYVQNSSATMKAGTEGNLMWSTTTEEGNNDPMWSTSSPIVQQHGSNSPENRDLTQEDLHTLRALLYEEELQQLP